MNKPTLTVTSSKLRLELRKVLDHVKSGGLVLVQRYDEPLAVIVPFDEAKKSFLCLEQQTESKLIYTKE